LYYAQAKIIPLKIIADIKKENKIVHCIKRKYAQAKSNRNIRKKEKVNK
jgi:hypothetical protein